jgi:hypothetical protein
MTEMTERILIPFHMKIVFPRNIDEKNCEIFRTALKTKFEIYAIGPVKRNDTDSGSHFFCDGFYEETKN